MLRLSEEQAIENNAQCTPSQRRKDRRSAAVLTASIKEQPPNLPMKRDEKSVLTSTATRAKLISDGRASLCCGGMERNGEDTHVPVYQGTAFPHPMSELCYVWFSSRIHSKAWEAECKTAWRSIKTKGSFQSAEQPLVICFKGRKKEIIWDESQKEWITVQAGIPPWPSLQSGSGSSQLLLQMMGWHWAKRKNKCIRT